MASAGQPGNEVHDDTGKFQSVEVLLKLKNEIGKT